MGEFVKVTDAVGVAEGALAAFDVGGERIAVANVGGTLHAFGDTCTHLHCSLAHGELEGTVVTLSLPRESVRRHDRQRVARPRPGAGTKLRRARRERQSSGGDLSRRRRRRGRRSLRTSR